jgi:hypothetical protein
MRIARAIRDLATPIVVPHLLQTAGEFRETGRSDWQCQPASTSDALSSMNKNSLGGNRPAAAR